MIFFKIIVSLIFALISFNVLALNNTTTGVVYARAQSPDPFQSVELVRKADDKAQALYDNCFRILNGPDSPEMSIQELDKELILLNLIKVRCLQVEAIVYLKLMLQIIINLS